MNDTINYQVYFNSNKIVLLQKNLNRLGAKRVNNISLENLKLKGTTSEIKSGSQSRIEKFLTVWLKGLYYNYERDTLALISQSRKPVFITLTLPAQQIHPDTVIKREILMPFIQSLKRSCNVRNYFWKAELQQNYNIHFHLIVDTYIPYKEIQKRWNLHCESLDYVSRFAMKHGHTQPPSTHVEAINSTSKAIAYIKKYICKSDQNGSIDGRKWEASKDIKNLKPLAYWLDMDIMEYVNYLVDQDKVNSYSGDFYTVLFFNNKFDWSKDYKFIEDIEKQDITKLHDELYSNKKPINLESKMNTEVFHPLYVQTKLDLDIPPLLDMDWR